MGEIGADLGDVVASEGIARCEARGGIGNIWAEDQNSLTNVSANEVKGHSGHRITCLIQEAFQGFVFHDGSTIGFRSHLRLNNLEDLQGANLVSHKITKSGINFSPMRLLMWLRVEGE